MSQKPRELFRSTIALLRYLRAFFVKWFLPLHTNDEDEGLPPPPTATDISTAQIASSPALATPDSPVEDHTVPTSFAEAEGSKAAPIVAPPPGAESRVARGNNPEEPPTLNSV